MANKILHENSCKTRISLVIISVIFLVLWPKYVGFYIQRIFKPDNAQRYVCYQVCVQLESNNKDLL